MKQLLQKYLIKSKIAFFVFTIIIIIKLSQEPLKAPNYTNKYFFYEPYDVVYTWVNGSDPKFIQQAQEIDPKHNPAQFDDKNELKYSLRSIEKYAPWVRHVYIVTNGQIPRWLNLEYDKVTVVPHHQLVDDPNVLPTLSSPAIETFLHRIPNLSKRFLYLNDDIFLGSPLYPEDLYTYENGVNVYPSHIVPDCAPDCPWVYIGDGSCDHHCNVEDCQFDGNDCIHNGNYGISIPNENLTSDSEEKNFDYYLFIEEEKKRSKPQKKRHFKSRSRWRNLRLVHQSIFAESLIHTNKIFNKAYGFKVRNSIAHVGFLLDKDIIERMLTKFQEEFSGTRIHRLRRNNDMQFPFAYYHYLMSETRSVSLEEIFDDFDKDKSETWSDREIRQLLTELFPSSLGWRVAKYFDQVIKNCSQDLTEKNNGNEIEFATIFERHENLSIPTITKSLAMNCTPLADVLYKRFGQRGIYRYNFNTEDKSSRYSNFLMLFSDITNPAEFFLQLRHDMKKFNCINVNLHTVPNRRIKNALEDFYLSVFPYQSKFELPPQHQNQFNYIDDYRECKRNRQVTLIFCGIFGSTLILIVVGLKYCCRPRAGYKYLRNNFIELLRKECLYLSLVSDK